MKHIIPIWFKITMFVIIMLFLFGDNITWKTFIGWTNILVTPLILILLAINKYE